MIIICVGPYISIITKPFRCSTMPRQKIDEKPKGTILCLLKSGSGGSRDKSIEIPVILMSLE